MSAASATPVRFRKSEALMDFEIPDFFRRNFNKGQKPMTSSTPRKRRADAYVARVSISILLDPSDGDSYSKAVKAIDGLAATLPAGTKIEFTSRSLGKIEA